MVDTNKKRSFRLVLEEDQDEQLRELAFHLRTTKTALIREAIDSIIAAKKAKVSSLKAY